MLSEFECCLKVIHISYEFKKYLFNNGSGKKYSSLSGNEALGIQIFQRRFWKVSIGTFFARKFSS